MNDWNVTDFYICAKPIKKACYAKCWIDRKYGDS